VQGKGGPALRDFAAPRLTAIAVMHRLRSLAMLATLAFGLLVWSQDADARLKSEWKFGGSLARTLLSLPFASAVFGDPFEDSILPSVAQPTYQGGSLDELFSRPGLVGGFAAGFLGAGLVGLLFGHGIVGELSGAASVLGLIFQLALLVMLGRLIWTWWRADRAARIAELSPRQLADAYGRSRNGSLPDFELGSDAGAGLGKLNNEAFSQSDEAGR
jgi:hypothetical protein